MEAEKGIRFFPQAWIRSLAKVADSGFLLFSQLAAKRPKLRTLESPWLALKAARQASHLEIDLG
jgi:hypothetical protein